MGLHRAGWPNHLAIFIHTCQFVHMCDTSTCGQLWAKTNDRGKTKNGSREAIGPDNIMAVPRCYFWYLLSVGLRDKPLKAMYNSLPWSTWFCSSPCFLEVARVKSAWNMGSKCSHLWEIHQFDMYRDFHLTDIQTCDSVLTSKASNVY